MESIQKTGKIPSVHKVLAHSYAAFFALFLIGICLDLVFFNSKILSLSGSTAVFSGFVLLTAGTLLILWAQKTSRSLKKEHVTKETFCHGPYCYTRSPTHWGLFFLSLGFGMLASAFFVIVFSFVAILVAKTTFLNKEEKILALKYGTPYLEYKRSVRL